MIYLQPVHLIKSVCPLGWRKRLSEAAQVEMEDCARKAPSPTSPRKPQQVFPLKRRKAEGQGNEQERQHSSKFECWETDGVWSPRVVLTHSGESRGIVHTKRRVLRRPAHWRMRWRFGGGVGCCGWLRKGGELESVTAGPEADSPVSSRRCIQQPSRLAACPSWAPAGCGVLGRRLHH